MTTVRAESGVGLVDESRYIAGGMGRIRTRLKDLRKRIPAPEVARILARRRWLEVWNRGISLREATRRRLREIITLQRSSGAESTVAAGEMASAADVLRTTSSVAVSERDRHPERGGADSSESRVPVVFVHYGNKEYLRYALQQARCSNTQSPIYLLGDETNRSHAGITHHMISDYSAAADEFARRYRHFSTNGPRAELLCFQRWFVLLEFMERNKVGGCLYLDSDVLLYANATEERQLFADYDLALVKYSVPCTVFLNQRQILAEFCDFLFDIYSGGRPYEWDRMVGRYASAWKNGVPGGASDMTVFELFHNANFGRIGELALIANDAVYDIAIDDTDPGLVMEGGIKKLSWRDGRPYGVHRKTGRDIRLKTLHCQGSNKARMEDCFRLAGTLEVDQIRTTRRGG